MKTLAELDAETAASIVDGLKATGIFCETHPKTDENGLDVTELLVDDDHYDKACEMIEAWDSHRVAEAERRAQRRCPFCNSARVTYVDDIDYEKTVTKIPAMYRCGECARVFVPRG